MAFCPNCGASVENYMPATPAEPVEITLARINAERDVAVARLEASARRAELATEERVAETEAEAQVDTAEAVATIIAAEDEPAPEPVPMPEPEPVIITQVNDDEVDEEITPPEVDHEPPAPHKRGLGLWGS